jgi:hypothetical protein
MPINRGKLQVAPDLGSSSARRCRETLQSCDIFENTQFGKVQHRSVVPRQEQSVQHEHRSEVPLEGYVIWPGSAGGPDSINEFMPRKTEPSFPPILGSV